MILSLSYFLVGLVIPLADIPLELSDQGRESSILSVWCRDPLSSFLSIAIKLCVGRAHQRERLHYGASDSLIGLGRK